MPRPPKTSRDCFLCCKDCPDRFPACSAHCEKYAAGKAEKAPPLDQVLNPRENPAQRWNRCVYEYNRERVAAYRRHHE